MKESEKTLDTLKYFEEILYETSKVPNLDFINRNNSSSSGLFINKISEIKLKVDNSIQDYTKYIIAGIPVFDPNQIFIIKPTYTEEKITWFIKIKNYIKNIYNRLMNFFKNLFKKKKEEDINYGYSVNQLSDNFSYTEMTQSYTASKYRIDNTPNTEELANLRILCRDVLQPIRNKYGKPIKVNSAYRCQKLNTKVGGAKNSDHLYGAAADIKAGDGNNRRLFDLIHSMIKNGELNCRQLIWEYGTRTSPQWIHISINHKHNSIKRNQVVYLFNK